MSDKQTLQSQIDSLKNVLASPKTDGTTRKILESGLKKAEAKLEELEKAEKMESAKKELTPKQEAKVEEVKKETKSLAQALKEKVKKAKEKIATTTPKATKKGGARSVAKAKELAKQRRSTQKKQSLKDSDIESDANRFAINKSKRRSHGGRANQYGTKAENKGGVYYERRENRYDVQNKRYAKLEKGGQLEPYIIWVSKGDDKRELYGEYKSQRAAEMAMKKLWDNSDYVEMGNKPKSKYDKEGFYEDGGAINDFGGSTYSTEDLSGMFAKGGMTEHGLMVGDTIVSVGDDPYSIIVRNNGVQSEVNLNDGTRMSNNQGIRFPSRFADGGAINDFGGTKYSTEDLSGMFANGGMINRDLNLYAKDRANELGVTRKDLGSDYSNALAQALVEGLTDANNHSEVRELISILEKRPEWAKDPYADKSSVPEFGSAQYSMWRENSVYSSMYYDADDNTRQLGIDVSQKSGYDGYGIAMAFKYVAQMNGEQKLASIIDKVFGGTMAKGGYMANGGVTNSMEDINYLKGVSGLRASYLEEWANKNNVDLSKVSKAIKTKKLRPIDLSTAISGRDGNKYAKDIIQKYSQNKMGMGGKTTFKDKVKAISNKLKGKKVSPSVQKDYGKTYSKDEAIDSAKRIAGAMRKKEMAKKKS